VTVIAQKNVNVKAWTFEAEAIVKAIKIWPQGGWRPRPGLEDYITAKSRPHCSGGDVQVAAENDVSLRDHCAELENVVVNLHRELDLQAAEHASRLAEHVATSQHVADQAEQRVSQLMADNDDLIAQLKVCTFCGFDFLYFLIVYIQWFISRFGLVFH